MNKGWTWKLVSWPWRRSMETFFRDIIIVPSVAVSPRLVIKQYDRDLTKNLEIFIYDCENVSRATNCDFFCTIVSISARGTYYLMFRTKKKKKGKKSLRFSYSPESRDNLRLTGDSRFHAPCNCVLCEENSVSVLGKLCKNRDQVWAKYRNISLIC